MSLVDFISYNAMMVRAAALFCSIVAASIIVEAQSTTIQKPEAPAVESPEIQQKAAFHPKIFWPMVGVYAASAVADIQSSNAGLKRDPGAHELNSWLLGRRPTLGRYYATDAVADGAIISLSYKLLHSHAKKVRALDWSLIITGTAAHTASAISNSRIH